jgi:hypothetical protein
MPSTILAVGATLLLAGAAYAADAPKVGDTVTYLGNGPICKTIADSARIDEFAHLHDTTAWLNFTYDKEHSGECKLVREFDVARVEALSRGRLCIRPIGMVDCLWATPDNVTIDPAVVARIKARIKANERCDATEGKDCPPPAVALPQSN